MMAANFKKKIKDRSGFSLAEVLVTVIILLLVTATVATGIPAASRAYSKVVNAANAQVLMSTTIIRLREELGTADNIITSETVTINNLDGTSSTKDTAISYDNSFGVRNTISLFKGSVTATYMEGEKQISETITSTKGNIFIQEYKGYDSSYKFYHPLVSDSAGGQKLYITYDSVEYENGVITFNKIAVYNKHIATEEQTPLAYMESFMIRTLTYIS